MCDVALSIVIPAFNEAHRLADTLQRLQHYTATVTGPYEIIVVDDGSRDATAHVARNFPAAPLPLRLIVNPTNRGKGHAVRRGVLASTGNHVLMCDADLSTPIAELEKLTPWLARGYAVVIGSRDLPDAHLDPPQPCLRRTSAAIFRTLRRRLLLPTLRDTQCGFKLFRGDVARLIFTHVQDDGWLFDCEALGLAERMGYRIKEVGVRWSAAPDTRVYLLRESLRALPNLWAIRRRLAAFTPKAGRGADT